MGDEWITGRLQDFAEVQTGPFGSQLHKKDYVDVGTPIITVEHLGDNKVIHSNLPCVSDSDRLRLKKYWLKKGDVVFSRVGSVDRRAYISDQEDGWLFSGRCLRVRVTSECLDSRYLSYFFGMEAVKEHIRQIAVGATMPSLNTSLLKGIEVIIPPIENQRAIAHILGTLDDKIELNRQMNETLEAMAQVLFKSWFVDFDPVVVNALRAGNPVPEKFAQRAAHYRENPHALRLPEDTLRLFPDRFQDSDLGPIPEGWEASNVGKEFDLTMGQSPPSSTYNEQGDGLPFFQGRRDFGFRYPSLRVYCTAPTRIANRGDTLVSVRAPVGDINMACEKCCVGRGVAAIRHKSGSRSYTYYAMQALGERFKRYEAEGTVFGSINKKQFQTLPSIAPPSDIISSFDSMVNPLDDNIDLKEKEMRTLTKLRDTLLSKLISGELRVPDAERLVEKAI